MPGPRYLFCGDRNHNDPYVIRLLMAGLHMWGKIAREPITIIHGGARGADIEAASAAAEFASNIKVEEYPAQWDKHGKGAGHRRNQQMLDEGNPSIVFAFHDHLSQSKGTKDMVRRAHARGIPVYVIRRYEP